MSKAIEALAAELLNLRERIRLLEMQEPSGGTDPNAIHVNVAAEISAIAAKAVPIGADYLIIEDSAAADVKKSITIADLPIAAVVPNHDHTGDAGDGAQISHDTALTGVSSDDHHAQAHKDTHDPEDGGDPLDTEAPVDTGTANAIGTSHNLVRGDHVHKLHDHAHAGVAGDGGTLSFNDLDDQPPVYVPLAAALTSVAFDGDSFPTTAKTLIDLSAVFGAPAGIKSVDCWIQCNDSGSAGGDCYVLLGPTNTNLTGVAISPYDNGNDVPERQFVTVSCDASGDIYYQILATGGAGTTFDLVIRIWGYYI